jgi:hypothetical protein
MAAAISGSIRLHGGVGSEIGGRQDRVEQLAHIEQHRVGNAGPSQIVGRFGVLQPPVQIRKLAV